MIVVFTLAFPFSKFHGWDVYFHFWDLVWLIDFDIWGIGGLKFHSQGLEIPWPIFVGHTVKVEGGVSI